MKKIFFIFWILINHNSWAQNWTSVNGNNFRNGLSKIKGPSSIASSYWNKTSSNPTDIGANIYTYNNRFVNSRVKFSPTYTAKIECRDVYTGNLIWQSPFITNSTILFASGFNEHAVYAHDYNTDSLYALNPDDGTILWKCPVTSMSFAPMDGIFFTCENDLIINGPDPVTSTMRVNRLTGDTMWTNNNVISVTPSAVMALNNSTVYRIDGSIVTPKRLYAIDVNTGATKYYSAAIPGDGDQENPLTIGPDGTIYFLRDGGFVYAFRDNGAGFIQLWTYTPVALPLGFTNISIDNDSNLLLLDNGKLQRIDHVNGNVIDSSVATFPQARITVGADSTVYVNDMTSMYYALSYDLQTVKWSLPVGTNYYAGPVLTKDGIFITCGAGTSLVAYKDSVSIKPVADFRADTTMVYVGDSLAFFDQSSFSPTSWSWSFPGGTPASSNLQNPNNIIYSSPGTYEVTMVASNAMGSDSLTKKCYIEVIQTNFINIAGITEDISLFPNPVNDYLYIRSSKNCFAMLYDAMGKNVMSRNLMMGLQKWDVHSLSAGIYFIRINANDKFFSRIIVIEK